MSAAELQRARALLSQGKPAEAKQAAMRALARSPRDAQTHGLASVLFAALGETERALFYAERSATLAPHDARAVATLGDALLAAGRTSDALPVLERAIERDPSFLEALVSRTHALAVLRRWSDAEAAARDALALHPNEPRLTGNLAACLIETGHARGAVDLLRAARAVHPDDLRIATALAQACTYADGLSAEEVWLEHKAYGDLLERLAPAPPAPHANTPEPERTIRVGLLSSDLRWHPVGLFVETLLRALPRDRLHVVCFATSSAEDAVTLRLRALSDTWQQVAHLSIGELVAAIRKDAIDILVDLGGHTASSRLPALHLKPAPVQASWLGYLNTTGLQRIDHRLVDAHTDPAEAQHWSAEALVRLEPAFLAYTPSSDAPETPPARDPAQPFTFGSFNALSKCTDATVELWSRVLNAAPGSRLVLRHTALGVPEVREKLRARFASHGIDPARISTEPPVPDHAALFKAYAHIDVALDPLPFNGGTTTCESLLAGLPVVTLPGERSCSRVGLSLLSAAGLKECVARDGAHYVQIASAFAREPDRLAALRAELPERIRASALCDGERFALSFEGALREMWRGWCARGANSGGGEHG